MVLMLLGLSVEVIVWPQTLSSSAFRFMVALGYSKWIGLFYLVVTYLRVLALLVNGRSSVYGPRARAWCALAGAVIWAQMDMALWKLMLENPASVPSPGIPIYFPLALSELFTVYRAMTDVRRVSS